MHSRTNVCPCKATRWLLALVGKSRRGFLSIMLLAMRSKGVGDSGHFGKPLRSQSPLLLQGGPHLYSSHLGGLGRVEVGA